MTVKEICEKYKCDHQIIYAKLKKDPDIFEKHIVRSYTGRIIDIDDFVIELLVPKENYIAELKCQIKNLTDVNTALTAECEKFKSANLSLSQDIDSLHFQITELSEKCKSFDDLLSENIRLSEELSAAVDKADEYHRENYSLLQKCSDLSGQLSEKSEKIILLNEKTGELKLQLDEKVSELSEVRSQNSKLISECEDLKAEIEELHALKGKKKGFFR